MPKLKTHRGAHKRVKLTGGGKLLRRRAFRNHFLGKKTSARKRRYGKNYEFKSNDTKEVKRQLGV